MSSRAWSGAKQRVTGGEAENVSEGPDRLNLIPEASRSHRPGLWKMGRRGGRIKARNPFGLTKGYDHSQAYGIEKEGRDLRNTSIKRRQVRGCCPAGVESKGGFQDGSSSEDWVRGSFLIWGHQQAAQFGAEKMARPVRILRLY